MIAYFDDLSGFTKGFSLDLGQLPATLGRAGDVTVRLTNVLVSRYHCEIDIEDHHLVVRDLGALNPTLLNDQPITKSPLAVDDLLTVGLQTFRVKSIRTAALEELHSDFLDDSLIDAQLSR